MFDFLKKKLKESVEKLTKKAEQPKEVPRGEKSPVREIPEPPKE
jgi:hypothetical protein